MPAALAAGRLWLGGVVTAVSAALVTLLGIVVARGCAHVPILAPVTAGTWGGAPTVGYVLGAAVVALAATGLMHLLVRHTRSPSRYFAGVMVPLTVAAAVLPLPLLADRAGRTVTALLNLLIGLVVLVLVNDAAAGAVGRVRAGPTGRVRSGNRTARRGRRAAAPRPTGAAGCPVVRDRPGTPGPPG